MSSSVAVTSSLYLHLNGSSNFTGTPDWSSVEAEYSEYLQTYLAVASTPLSVLEAEERSAESAWSEFSKTYVPPIATMEAGQLESMIEFGLEKELSAGHLLYDVDTSSYLRDYSYYKEKGKMPPGYWGSSLYPSDFEFNTSLEYAVLTMAGESMLRALASNTEVAEGTKSTSASSAKSTSASSAKSTSASSAKSTSTSSSGSGASDAGRVKKSTLAVALFVAASFGINLI